MKTLSTISVIENADADRDFVQKRYPDAQVATDAEDGMVDIWLDGVGVIGFGRTEAQAWHSAVFWVNHH